MEVSCRSAALMVDSVPTVRSQNQLRFPRIRLSAVLMEELGLIVRFLDRFLRHKYHVQMEVFLRSAVKTVELVRTVRFRCRLSVKTEELCRIVAPMEELDQTVLFQNRSHHQLQ